MRYKFSISRGKPVLILWRVEGDIIKLERDEVVVLIAQIEGNGNLRMARRFLVGCLIETSRLQLFHAVIHALEDTSATLLSE